MVLLVALGRQWLSPSPWGLGTTFRTATFLVCGAWCGSVSITHELLLVLVSGPAQGFCPWGARMGRAGAVAARCSLLFDHLAWPVLQAFLNPVVRGKTWM